MRRCPEFELVPALPAWPRRGLPVIPHGETLRAQYPVCRPFTDRLPLRAADRLIRAVPGTDQTCGFFVALFKRRHNGGKGASKQLSSGTKRKASAGTPPATKRGKTVPTPRKASAGPPLATKRDKTVQPDTPTGGSSGKKRKKRKNKKKRKAALRKKVAQAQENPK